MQGRAFGPPRRGLALHCGGVPPRNGWRLAWPEPPTGGDQPPHFPDCRRQAGRAAAPPPHRVGRVSGPQAAGAGGTRPARRRDTDGSPFPQAARPPERTKEGVPTGHSLLVLLIKGRPASRSERWRLSPAPT